MRERWKKIYHDYYEVSTLGRVRRIVSGSPNTYSGRILNPSKISRYPLVVLYGPDGEKKTIRVHLLVARAFIGPCPEGMEVNHKDTNKWNCRLTNLEYLTPQKNSEHASKKGLTNRTKMPLKIVRSIRNAVLPLSPTGRIKRGFLKRLAIKHNVSSDFIRGIRTGVTWKWA